MKSNDLSQLIQPLPWWWSSLVVAHWLIYIGLG